MLLLQIWACKPLSTAGADSLDFPQMCLIHMASAVLLLDPFEAFGPGALYFVSSALLNRKRELLAEPGRRTRQGFSSEYVSC